MSLALKEMSFEGCSIEVEIIAGKVILDGTVQTDEQKDLAGTAAAKVPRTLKVENRLFVDLPVRGGRSNQETADAVARALRRAHLSGSGIEISVSRETATLTGQVKDRRQKRTAERAAASVPEITRVENQLVVAGEDRISLNPAQLTAVATSPRCSWMDRFILSILYLGGRSSDLIAFCD